MKAKALNLIVGIATSGRREILSRGIENLSRQTRLPDCLVVCPIVLEDVDTTSLKKFPVPTVVVNGPAGLPAQRNRILSAAAQADIIVFFDDDFFADPRYLENIERIFVEHSDVVAVTGVLLADGAQGSGLSVEQGLEILQSHSGAVGINSELIECYGTYGCNMAFRLDPVVRHQISFDENLPLYGWQEDIDFSQRILRYGRIVKSATILGVHLGIKVGRTSGVRFGYSQVANPIYLVRKGTMSWRHAKKLIVRNIAANLVRSLYPEPWIDRKGRLKGNLLALIDIITGRMSPRRILQLS
jgi:GT2 family glycosyltransferase